MDLQDLMEWLSYAGCISMADPIQYRAFRDMRNRLNKRLAKFEGRLDRAHTRERELRNLVTALQLRQDYLESRMANAMAPPLPRKR